MRKSSMMVPRLSLENIKSPPKRQKSVTFNIQPPSMSDICAKVDPPTSCSGTDRSKYNIE